ncbi:MAG: rRNA maturation RNase YbeY [Candidatus Omnitrophota bacterium]|nr:rRNA maturation RNase YbeY [Candidatus Omnitrophota bacterium]
MIEIINRQKIKRINLKYLRRHLKKILAFLFINSCGIGKYKTLPLKVLGRSIPMDKNVFAVPTKGCSCFVATARKFEVVNLPTSLASELSCDVSIVLCDNKFIRRLNKDFFKKNNPTDVISFPLRDDFTRNYLGEIIISVEEANLRAKKYGNTWQQELLFYIIHGILHLLGYKDYTKRQRARMERKQNEIFYKLIEADKRPAYELKFSAGSRRA